jgi:catechol 2,3-dioxygenase-like lactoylglutathione lyase family enzyme
MVPVIKILDIAHVRFSAPNLVRMQEFLTDFGFRCDAVQERLYATGSDGRPFLHVTEKGEPGFRALGLRAASIEDLEKLAVYDGAKVELSDEPGGGSIVRLTDPDGFLVEVMAGQQNGKRTDEPVGTQRNDALNKPRLGATVRLEQGPSRIQRIGHSVLNVSDFRRSEKWYKDRFGFLTSDEIEAAPGTSIGAFLRCDRGSTPSDHHTLFLAQTPQPVGFMHAAFEVSDFDDLMLGHTHLRSKGRDQAWGIGRHIMGSQIFDYWRDPWGHELEHWTDGDLLTADEPPNKMSFESLIAVQWGQPFPMKQGSN